jgi:hypothetical protein
MHKVKGYKKSIKKSLNEASSSLKLNEKDNIGE